MNNHSDNISFQDIAEHQQMEVLRYLEATNTDDVEGATQLLARFNFNTSEAISQRFGGSTNRSQSQQHRETTIEQQRELGQYIRHLQQVMLQRTVWKIISGAATSTVRKVLRRVFSYVLPDCLKQRLVYSKFDRMYARVSSVKFESTNLIQVLQKAQYNGKPCLLFVAAPDQTDRTLLQLFSRTEVASVLNSRFFCYGMTWDSKQLQNLELVIEPSTPMILAAYMTIMDKPRILKTFKLTDNDDNEVVMSSKTYQEVMAQYRSERKHEKNIQIRYNNMVLSHYHDQAATDLMEEEIPEDEVDYETERRIIQEQQRQYQEAMEESRKAQEKRQTQLEIERKHSQELTNLKQERKIRKMSIPDEPQEGQVIKLYFRCPDGSKIVRGFNKNQLLELVYNWVETNEEIEFEDERRQFQLLTGYPPQPLENRKLQKISSVFDDDREQIVIKQL